MIEVQEALQRILKDPPQPRTVSVPIASAAERVLAQDILAPIPSPIFDQSAVDGYALLYTDREQTLRVVGEIKAGDPADIGIGPGECLRIFTGAPVPASADTVVMQEYAERSGDTVRFSDAGLKKGGNIRLKGEQLEAGAVALQGGRILDAAGIGLLAMLGIAEVTVVVPPRAAIIVTGNEFAEGPEDLRQGKIYESNGTMLQAMLSSEGFESRYVVAEDDPEAMLASVAAAAVDAELVIMTGGVSVGAYDFTRASLEGAGFETVFHKVNQKPGKPLLFARKGEQVAFGLPGNPRAVLMCYYQYVRPWLRQAMGLSQLQLPTLRLPLIGERRKRDGKTHFVTGVLRDGQVDLLGGQNSHMLKSFAEADAIVTLPAAQDTFSPGALLDVQILPR